MPLNLLTLPAPEAERLAYAEGFTMAAELFARIAELEAERDSLAEEVENMKDALYMALPYVEDHEGSDTYKPGTVKKAIREIRKALGESTE